MILWPCVRYLAGGVPRVLWLAPREALSLELGEPAIEHALATARDERGTDIRIEFAEAGAVGRCVMRVRVP